MHQSENEAIKVKLRAFSERYDRLITEAKSTRATMNKDYWEYPFIGYKIVADTASDNFFKALFADEIKKGGE